MNINACKMTLCHIHYGHLGLTGLWRDIHRISIKDSSIYVIRDSRRFLSNLLNGMPTAQELETETIFTCILQPILSAKSFTELPPDDVSFSLCTKYMA